MEDIIKFSKVNKSILLIRFFILYISIYVLIISLKYSFEDLELDYFSYLFSFKHYGLINIIVDIMFLLYLFENKTVEYDNEKICLRTSSPFFNKNTCIFYNEIIIMTYKFGIASIRTDKKIIMLDTFTFKSKDIKCLMSFLEIKNKQLANPKMKKKELIGIVFFILILILFYVFVFKLYS